MAAPRTDFRAAFDRWNRVCATEQGVVEGRVKKGEPLVSREALDHLCGLAAEVGMKYLLLNRGLEKADPTGDYPRNADGRRPHVDELWNVFMAKASGRKGAELLSELGGVAPLRVFQTWQTSNRYAPDDTVKDVETKPRLDFLKKLGRVIAQEGV